jgi:hypothetical protein
MDNDKRKIFTYFEGLLRFFLGSRYFSGCLAVIAVALIVYATVSQVLKYPGEKEVISVTEKQSAEETYEYETSLEWLCRHGCIVTIEGCDIKATAPTPPLPGFYYLPGWEGYDDIKLDPDEGDRWFCSELDAIRNGFVKMGG